MSDAKDVVERPRGRPYPKIEFRPVDRRKGKSLWLKEHGRNVKTTQGEDGIFLKIFEIIGINNKFLVEFGAADGSHLSNSYNLLNNEGWKGLLLEPARQFPALSALYADRDDVVTIEDIVGFDDSNNLDAHLDRMPYDVPYDFDFLSIDIDGNDLHVWMDIKKYKPRVVCIEFNYSIPLDVYLLQPKDINLCIGSSLLATVEVGRELGYELVCVCGTNALFVLKEDFDKFGIADNSPEAMAFVGIKETKLVHAYDGTLYIAGLKKHPWKGFRIDEARIQPLPSNMREWKFSGRRLWPDRKLT